MTGSRAQEPDVGRTAPPLPAPAETLRGRVDGHGPDVLLIHGLSAHGGEWDAVSSGLSGRFRVLRPDLAGRGDTPAPAGARFGLGEEVGRLAAYAAAMRIERPVLAGHSHGAALAVGLAGRIRARALLLVNPVTPWTRRPPVLGLLRSRPVRRALAPVLRHYRDPLTRYILTRRVYADPALASAEAVSSYAAPLADAERVDWLLRVLADWRPSELVGFGVEPGTPVAVLAGALDRRIPVATAGRWARQLGGSFEVLSGCAHGIPEEAPGRVAGWILKLDETSRG